MQEELEFLTCQARHIELACALREKWHLFQAVSEKRKKNGSRSQGDRGGPFAD